MNAMRRRGVVAVLLVLCPATHLVAQSSSASRVLRTTSLRTAAAAQVTATQALQDGNYVETLSVFDALLQSADEHVGPLQTEIELRLTSISSDERARIEQQVRPAAEAALAAALASDDDQSLSQFLKRYGWTGMGASGWLARAARARDRAEWQQLSACGLRVLENAAATPAQRAQGLLCAIDGSLRSGGSDVALRLWAQWERSCRATQVRYAGAEVLLSDVIEPRLASLNTTAHNVADQDNTPALLARWERPLRPEGVIRDELARLARTARADGAVSFPALQPVVAGNVVVVRALDQLVACDIETGRELWHLVHPEYTRLKEHPALLENTNPVFRSASLDSLWRREQVETCYSRLTCDDTRVYTVEESSTHSAAARLRTPAFERDEESPAPIFNQLAAFDLTTGDLAWRIGGGPASPSYPLGGVYFLGPPTPVDDTLFGVAQRDEDVGVYALDRHRGTLLWWVRVGHVERPLSTDLLRRAAACPVVWHDGLLLCPTAAGAVVAIEAATRQIRWIARPKDRQREVVLPAPGTVRPKPRQDPYWDGWRTAQIVVADDRALCTSPESPEWVLLHLTTGEILRRGPRDGALAVAGIANDHAFLTESTAVRSVALATGQTRWRSAMGDVAGPGVLHDGHLLQPLADGTLAQINLQSGQLQSLCGGENLPTGSLTRTARGWLITGPTGLCALPNRATALTPDDDSSDARPLLSARLQIQSGRAKEAWQQLQSQSSADSHALQVTAGCAWLEQEPAARRELAPLLLKLASSADERFRVRLALLEAALAEQALPGAVDLLLEGLADHPEGTWPVPSDRPRVVRRDRLLQGRLDQLLRSASPADRTLMEQRLQQQLEVVLTDPDPFALQRWLEGLGPLPWARQVTLQHAKGAFLGRTLLETELRLLDIAGSPSSVDYVAARIQLAEMLQAAGFPQDAAALWDRLIRSRPGTQTAAGETVSRLRQDLPDPSAAEAWPLRKPWADTQKTSNEDAHQFGSIVHAEPGSPIDRLDVSIGRQGFWVQFIGEGQAGPWRADLPSSSSPFRFVYFLHETWGLGRLAIVRVGTELFGITPFDERGEPRAKVLWTVDTAGAARAVSDQVDIVMSHDRPGVRSDKLAIFDPAGREVSAVGPVRPGYLCYREQAVLRAVSTTTGSLLWERFDIPDGTVTFGDDDTVCLWQPTTGRLELLSSLDGRTLAERTWSVQPDDLLQTIDTRAWVIERGPETVLKRVDVAHGTTEWSYRWPGEATPFLLDADTIGLLDTRGLLGIVSAETGALLTEPLTVPCPAAIDRIGVAVDGERWYVTWTPRLDNLWLLQRGQPRSSLRMPFINGVLLAIDRSTHHVAWSRTLLEEPFPLDQLRNAPVLFQLWKLPATGGTSSATLGEGRLRLIDKRTGEVSYETQSVNLQPYLSIQPNARSQLLDLRLTSETVRLHYRGEPPAADDEKSEP